MVSTIKFSEFDDAPLVNDDLSSVGLENGVNVITTKYPTWQTVTRPATPFVALMGYNTDLQSYEFWDGLAWTQLEDSTDIAVLLALLASHVAGEGASLIGLENQGSVTNKTVQDFNEATFIAQTDNGTLPNGQFLSALATGFMASTTATGVVATRLLVATANQIDISNTNGSGNPAFSLSATLDFPGTYTVQGSTVIDEIIDDDTMATATDSNLATAESIVAYIASVIGGAAGGANGNIQYNNLGAFGGDANFNTDGAGNIDITGSLDVDNININGNVISSTNVDGDITLTPNGNGEVNISSALDLTTHQIHNVVDPTADQDAATKAYVDAIAAAFNSVFVARLASTVALTVTYDNGVAGVGATLTNADVQAALTLDGVAAVVGNLVLIKNQASTLQNGYYIVTDIGSGATNWVLTRSTAYDTPTEIQPGDLFIITAGSTQTNTSWVQTATVTAVGVDAITFTQYSTALPVPITQGGTGATNAADARTNLGLGTIAVQDANNVNIDGGTIDSTTIGGTTPAAGTFTTLVGTTTQGGNILLTGDAIQHVGDLNNQIVFGTDTQSFETGGSSRLDISDAGVRMGAANSRVTTILDEDDMASNSNTALCTQQSIKAYVDSFGAGAVMPYGYINGFTLSKTAARTAQFEIGICKDNANVYSIYNSGNLSKTISANWTAGDGNGGLGQGLSLTTNTWYHCFVIFNPTTLAVDAGYDTSVTATNLLAGASGYTSYRRVGSILTDSSANIVAFTQLGDEFYWSAPPADVNGTVTTTVANYTLSVPPDVKNIAILNVLTNKASNNPTIYLHSPDVSDQAATASVGTSPQATWATTVVTTTGGGGPFRIPTNTSKQIQAISNVVTSNFGVATVGWKDFRGTNNR